MMKIFLTMVVAFGCFVLALAAVAGTVYLFIRLLGGGVSREAQRLQSEETRMIQDIYHGLLRMEERVETLETILLDRERNKKERRANNETR